MKYAHLEKDTNKILGWYADDIHSEIPTPNIKAEDDVWQEAININANCYENGKFIVKDFRTDKEIEQQELQYKLQEALDFLNNTDKKVLPDYEFREDDNTLEWYIAERKKAREYIRGVK